jgi:hypothetical protein
LIKKCCTFVKKGPATRIIGGKMTLIGVTSFGLRNQYSLCTPEYPSGYARVSTQLEWIHKNTDVSDWDCN